MCAEGEGLYKRSGVQGVREIEKDNWQKVRSFGRIGLILNFRGRESRDMNKYNFMNSEL